jgi:hypothetical protein
MATVCQQGLAVCSQAAHQQYRQRRFIFCHLFTAFCDGELSGSIIVSKWENELGGKQLRRELNA